MNIDRVLEVSTKLFRFFLSKSISRNNCVAHVRLCQTSGYSYRRLGLTFKCLFDVDSLLSTCLEVGDIALRLAESSGSLARDLYFHSHQHEVPQSTERRVTYYSLALLHIDLVTKNHLVISMSADMFKGLELPVYRLLTKGKLSGSRGEAWIRNSSLQLSSASKLLELLTSNTNTQQSAPR